MIYRLSADLVLIVHLGFVLFVVLGACSHGDGAGSSGSISRPCFGVR
jgi:hypothetical protein